MLKFAVTLTQIIIVLFCVSVISLIVVVSTVGCHELFGSCAAYWIGTFIGLVVVISIGIPTAQFLIAIDT